MKKTAATLSVALASLSQGAIIASHDFDSPSNLIGTSSSPVSLNGFSSSQDAWGIYNFTAGGPADLFDATVAAPGGGVVDPTDIRGIVQSTKTDNFFGISDTLNPDTVATSGEVSAEFAFDISSTIGLSSIDISFAGMGDIETSDVLSIAFSIDGGSFTDIFTSNINGSASQNYTMENGSVINLQDPIAINGTQLNNNFQTVSAPISGTGSTLTLRLTANFDGGEEIVGLDDIVINGTIPEVSSTLLGSFGMIIGLLYRRR